ncbi:hypothetical protein [Tenacibaculum sp. 190524A05c]|uniref:hypothetical protein n=1 Tax=Tenacibaculum platacis TaxID=3137852 RepID=UPI0032B18CF0
MRENNGLENFRPLRLMVFIVFVLFPKIGLSQVDQDLKKLRIKREQLEKKILELNKSLNDVEKEIRFHEANLLRKKLKDSLITTTIRSGGKIKDGPHPLAKILKKLSEKRKVVVVSYENDYFKVCLEDMCGYINEMWVSQNQSTKDLIRSAKISQFTKESKSKKRAKYKSVRTYYRGPKGGCFYYNNNGKKVYVDKKKCY